MVDVEDELRDGDVVWDDWDGPPVRVDFRHGVQRQVTSSLVFRIS